MEQNGNNRNKMVRHVAMAGVLALAGAGFASTAWAGMLPEGYVKCYGIAKAHQNQ